MNNPSKIDLGGALGTSRGAPGSHVHLGKLKNVWEFGLGGLLEWVGDVSWIVLRAKMVPSGVPRGRFLGSRNEAKMDALLGASWGRHFHEFGWIFGRQNGAKLASNWSSTTIEHGKVCF